MRTPLAQASKETLNAVTGTGLSIFIVAEKGRKTPYRARLLVPHGGHEQIPPAIAGFTRADLDHPLADASGLQVHLCLPQEGEDDVSVSSDSGSVEVVEARTAAAASSSRCQGYAGALRPLVDSDTQSKVLVLERNQAAMSNMMQTVLKQQTLIMSAINAVKPVSISTTSTSASDDGATATASPTDTMLTAASAAEGTAEPPAKRPRKD